MPIPTLLIDQMLDATDFIIYAVLYHRDVYPKEIFEMSCCFDVPVIICSHSSITSYLSLIRPVIRELLIKDNLRAVVIAISVNDVVWERHWIEFQFDTDAFFTDEDSFLKRNEKSATKEFRSALNDCLRNLDVSCNDRKPIWSFDDESDVEFNVEILPRNENGKNLKSITEQSSLVTTTRLISADFIEPESSLCSRGFFKVQVSVVK